MQQIASTKAFTAGSKPAMRAGRSSLVVSAVKVGDAAPSISLKDQVSPAIARCGGRWTAGGAAGYSGVCAAA